MARWPTAAIWAVLFLAWVEKCVNFADTGSFLARDRAWQAYSQATEAMEQNVDLAIQELTLSFQLYPNVVSARKLAWIFDMLGDQTSSLHWQRMQATMEKMSIVRWLHTGTQIHYSGDYVGALGEFDSILQEDPHYAEALYHKGVSYQYLGDVQSAAEFYWRTTEVDPYHTKALLNLAALHQKYGSFDDAVRFYRKAAGVFSMLRQRSVPEDAATPSPPYLHPHDAMVQYNLGLAYMQLNNLDEAYKVTKQLLHRLREVQASLPADPGGRYDAWEIEQGIAGALGSLSKIQRAALNWRNWEVLHEQLVHHTLSAIQHNRDHYCDGLVAYEGCSPEQYGDGSRKIPFMGPLLPFDTLMMVMPMQTRLDIAVATSLSYLAVPYSSSANKRESSATVHIDPMEQQRLRRQRKLRLGFISYDFNDHPTAHLIEAVFQIIITAQQRSHSPSDNSIASGGDEMRSIFHSVELVIFNYGRDDGSHYRRNLEALAHNFVNIAEKSFTESAALIRAEGIDILLDLQIHTLGSRLEITASGVAPTVVNYLVYPGTSGARFYDYLVADAVVVPPEQALFYSERLLLVPPTYQVSGYDHYAIEVVTDTDYSSSLRGVRGRFGLPTEADVVIFCNFNKINKIDPESFVLWKQILRTIPNSYLWLMEPRANGGSASSSKAALLRSVAAEGVARGRILFAPRASKQHHIQRHAAADLFLDTVVYGAHSTATDALRGGLPVLTLRGEAFPSRVAASLYTSFAHNAPCRAGATSELSPCLLGEVLVADSAKEFVDTATRLARLIVAQRRHQSGRTEGNAQTRQVSGLKAVLQEAIAGGRGFFNATRNVELFVRGMQVLEDTKTAATVFAGSPHARRFHAALL